MIKRDSCRFCGGKHLKREINIPEAPLTEQFLLKLDDPEFIADVEVFSCQSCGQYQTLLDICDQDYYQDYSYTVGQTNAGQSCMKALGRFMSTQYLERGNLVVDIGSGSGHQLEVFKKSRQEVVGFEISHVLAEQSLAKGIPTIEHEFSADLLEHRPNLIMSSFTFDHMPDPMGFLQQARTALRGKGLLLIEVHDLAVTSRKSEFALIQHEHTGYYTAQTLKLALKMAGFDVLVKNPLPAKYRRGNSLMILATPINLGKDSPSFGNPKLKLYNMTWQRERYRQLAYSRRGKLAGYGAGARGVMTLAQIAEPSWFKYVVDDNPAYQGKHTPKSHVPIVGPDRLREDPPEELWVFSHGYLKEITETAVNAGLRPDQIRTCP